MDTATIIGIFTGAIGAGYFIYGKKQSRYVAIISGVGLNTLPWFVTNVPLLLVLCAMMLAAPFVIKE